MQNPCMKLMIPFTPHLSHECLELHKCNSINKWPVIKTKTESMIARTINPIVCGSFKTRKLMIEKKEANKSKTVDNSNTSIKIVFTKLLIYCL